ncbi:MAG: phosphatase PAP2 family protein [Ferruginibacter sp.]
MQKLKALDRVMFSYLNGSWHNPVFDYALPIMRHAYFWAPLYLFILVLVLQNSRKNVLLWLLFTALVVTLSDYISSDLIKENFFRLRPCNDLTLVPPARLLLSYRPQSSSFISSHAANHFCIAMFFFLTLKNLMGKYGLWLFAWAAFICYAQVYVGVHYPLDVIAGAIVGIVFGYLCGTLANRYFPLA